MLCSLAFDTKIQSYGLEGFIAVLFMTAVEKCDILSKVYRGVRPRMKWRRPTEEVEDHQPGDSVIRAISCHYPYSG